MAAFYFSSLRRKLEIRMGMGWGGRTELGL
jgi:hypothetical protein